MINKRFIPTGKKILYINVINKAFSRETGNGKIYQSL
jgi:hypothetical protein